VARVGSHFDLWLVNMAEMEVELPRALIKRIVKAKLAEQADLGDDEGKREFQLNKDATTAFCQATKVFITYVSSAAHDICRENNRSTVAPQDIIQALDELCFQDFIPDLQDLLTGTRPKIGPSVHSVFTYVHIFVLTCLSPSNNNDTDTLVATAR
jgi:histone H3/H4